MAGSDSEWLARWLDAVRDGGATMGQRARSAIDRYGGLEAAIAAARARGVRLIELTDDKDKRLVAASRHAFQDVVLVSDESSSFRPKPGR